MQHKYNIFYHTTLIITSEPLKLTEPAPTSSSLVHSSSLPHLPPEMAYPFPWKTELSSSLYCMTGYLELQHEDYPHPILRPNPPFLLHSHSSQCHHCHYPSTIPFSNPYFLVSDPYRSDTPPPTPPPLRHKYRLSSSMMPHS